MLHFCAVKAPWFKTAHQISENSQEDHYVTTLQVHSDQATAPWHPISDVNTFSLCMYLYMT